MAILNPYVQLEKLYTFDTMETFWINQSRYLLEKTRRGRYRTI
jgi:hypothetical protein